MEDTCIPNGFRRKTCFLHWLFEGLTVDLYQRFGGGPTTGYGDTPVAVHVYEIGETLRSRLELNSRAVRRVISTQNTAGSRPTFVEPAIALNQQLHFAAPYDGIRLKSCDPAVSAISSAAEPR